MVGTGSKLIGGKEHALAGAVTIISASETSANYFIDDIKFYTYTPD